ncbi:hypothetical protein ACG04R_05020 [Roseateles sp. BYS78W]|uniref:Uncharacterized protein n=1 Tax=Pelomonas candidula TaxID=3299025 RepID=A0ABW7H8B3_9BURK
MSRIPPPKVAPVVVDGIRYAQMAGDLAADGQMGGMLAAFGAGGEVLWTLKVYDNRRLITNLEGDVQDVFFRSMSVDPDRRLRIINESGGIFLVDLQTRSVTAAGEVRRVHPDGLQFMPEPPA